MTAGFIELGNPQILLLPGLDGTGRLFSRFIASAPAHLSVTAVALPAEALNYNDLAVRVAESLPNRPPLVLIAESFSGPLAVALAQHLTTTALVFCNSFVVTPRTRMLRWFVQPVVFRLPMHESLLRRYLLGASADRALVAEVAEVVASVPASVLASRLRTVFDADETTAFRRCAVPTLYVRGTADRLVPDGARRRMAAIRPISNVDVPGPHLLLQANPVGVWNAIAPFLKSLLND